MLHNKTNQPAIVSHQTKKTSFPHHFQQVNQTLTDPSYQSAQKICLKYFAVTETE